MLRFIIAAGWIVTVLGSCPLNPPIYQSSTSPKLHGDGGYRILISGEYDNYIPNAIYSISLRGPSIFEDSEHKFNRFLLSLDSKQTLFSSSARVGYFQIFADSPIKFYEECVNTIAESSNEPKYEVQVLWRAPPSGAGCVEFKAMVMESSSRWFAEDGELTKVFCEMSREEIEKLDEARCCACDEAKYNLVFEGIWSNTTHPKDYPSAIYLTHFSDLIGGSHQTNFSFWGRDVIASDGFRQLAEWGSTAALEAELQLKADHFNTLIKAPGLWYPNVNSNTTTNFNVDRKKPMLSVASMVGPSPDWVVGVSKLNLCQKDCSWIRSMTVDLYPWDAGTDNGITYMSSNSETNPRETMKPITTRYPEDPRSPFYDPTGRPMLPLARLYLNRAELIRKNCNEQDTTSLKDSNNQFIAQRSSDAFDDCATTDFTTWSECSVTCGTGVRTRTRSYRRPDRAILMRCNKQLVAKEICEAAISECFVITKRSQVDCSTGDWSAWSECNVSCGIGYKTRRRQLNQQSNYKKCYHVSLEEKEKCVLPRCLNNFHREGYHNPACKVSEWSEWSPCSATCGKGIKVRTRSLTTLTQESEKECMRKIELQQSRACLDQADCTFNQATIKAMCMELPETGPCRGDMYRWAYNPQKQTCVLFRYGGCAGNANNFPSMVECMKTCDFSNVRNSIAERSNGKELGNDSGLNLLNFALAESAVLPVDCQVSDWSPWSNCSVNCGVGTIISYRTITQEPRNNGKPCPLRMQRRARCHREPCKS